MTDEPPEWVEDALCEYDWYLEPIVEAIMNLIDTMAQYTSDTCEKEGAVYIASYVITDFLLGKAMKGAGKADDVADVAGAAEKADDVANVAKAADRTAGVKKLSEMTDKELAKLGYKRYGEGKIFKEVKNENDKRECNRVGTDGFGQIG